MVDREDTEMAETYQTLEQFFIEDYNDLRTERDSLRERVRELEGTPAPTGFGITDLDRKFTAVRGSVCSSWVVHDKMLEKGKITAERMRELVALEDRELFERCVGHKVDYYSLIDYEEHEFQYTLHVRESRDNWTAVTDGKVGSKLEVMPDRRPYEEMCEGEWYPIDDADALKEFLGESLRAVMEKALAEYEREQEVAEEHAEED